MIRGLLIAGMGIAVTALLPTGTPLVSQDQPLVPAAAEAPGGEAPDASFGDSPTDGFEGFSGGYLPPVDGEVVDYFRAPAHVGGPGNRGWEYLFDLGQPVVASAEGEVVFAGTVVGNQFVTVRHSDGLRTSYGYLGSIGVSKGDQVLVGQVLGTTTDRFFFSVRAGDRYLDPALVLSAGGPRLVPHQGFDSGQALLRLRS